MGILERYPQERWSTQMHATLFRSVCKYNYRKIYPFYFIIRFCFVLAYRKDYNNNLEKKDCSNNDGCNATKSEE